jgi:hypothetical protein
MNPTRTERRAHARAATQARLQEQRQQPLPAWLATRTARRALALLPVATFAIGVLAAAAGGGFPTAMISVAVALVSYALAVLRRATRMLDNTPENLLDEREISDRDHAYRRGFRLTLVLLGALTLLAGFDSFLAEEAGVQLFDTMGWVVLLVASFLTATMLPAAALAWTWREPDDLDE